MAHRPEDVRNVALVGAGGAGKTTLAEALLHLAKAVTRQGTVPEKNTVSDYDPDEKERQHSILATPLHLTWEGKRIQLIDCPGALDFIGEAVTAMAAVEIAAICVNAHDGVGVATRRAYKAAREAGLPCCVIVTRVETENVDAQGLVDGIRQTFGEQAVPLNLPDQFGHGVSSVVDVFGDDVPEHLAEAVAKYHEQAMERVVEVDEALINKYFEEGEVSKEELETAFPDALREGNIVPILHVSVEKDVGLKKLLEFIVHD
ncbi:MAG: GTP-binding protein, partial [Planctomycetota bacterium]